MKFPSVFVVFPRFLRPRIPFLNDTLCDFFLKIRTMYIFFIIFFYMSRLCTIKLELTTIYIQRLLFLGPDSRGRSLYSGLTVFHFFYPANKIRVRKKMERCLKGDFVSIQMSKSLKMIGPDVR
jgi:hypothetical protein